MWTFFVEVLEVNEEKASCTSPISFAFGDAPEQAPEKEFTADKIDDEFDPFNEDEIGFDNIDDIDLDKY